jgi:hypothetical protein
MLRMYLILVLAGFALTACQQTQLTYAANTGAAAVEPVFRQQALSNFAKLLDNPAALPSQVNLASGTLQANSSVTPSVSFPLSSMFASALAITPTGVTNTGTTTTAGASSTLSGSYGFQLQFVVNPLTDTIALHNLQTIYMAVLCNSLSSEKQRNFECDRFAQAKGYVPPRMYSETNKLVLDPYYLNPPLCIRCPKNPDPNNLIDASQADTLPPAPLVAEQWLYWTTDATPSKGPEGYVSLGSAEGIHFYATKESIFSDFMLATLPLPAPSPTRYPPKQAIPLARPETGVGVAPGGRTPQVRPQPTQPPSAPLFTPQQIPGSSEPAAPLFRNFVPQGILPPPS